MANFLLSRGLLFDQGSSSNFTCARPLPDEHGEPLSIGITFKKLMIYTTFASLCLTLASTVLLIWKHLHWYTRPQEQRQHVRIIALPVFFCVVALLSVIFYQDSIYIKPLIEVYEAFCVAALFLLFIEYVCPEENKRATFFENLQYKDNEGNVILGGGLKWFNVGTKVPR
ncbi:hypothetical protein VTN77DRAFT_2646 [Rasamsonia byssochlamydoides]|uniref:uncharacterized protein n=1 Tax=Rasamsonia byssochlamydoides TaxID=89139 RepID=UPI003742588B